MECVLIKGREMKPKNLFLLGLFLLLVAVLASAADKSIDTLSDGNINITIFYGRECPYCHKTLQLLDELAKENPAIQIEKIETWHSMENYALFRETVKRYGYDPDRTGVPFTIIDGHTIEGFYPEKIRSAIDACFVQMDENEFCVADTNKPSTVSHFLFGTIDLKELSLPMLTIVLGIADGFNPCAMWVLVYLISILIATKDRKKIWLIVGTFVFASAVLYFIFLTAWLNLFLFIGFLPIVQIAVGVMAIATGIWHLKSHLSEKEAVCKVTDESGRRKIMEKINELTKKSIVPATLLGIVLLAFTVNLIEFVCSAGIPAVFTKTLTMSKLSVIEYYGYILLYDFFFMLDDILIFGGAALTLQFVDVTEKYVRYAGTIGGILLLILGILLIFYPQALAFI